MTIKIGDLFILVCFKTKDVYPRIFTSREEARDCIEVIGTNYEMRNAFINQE